MHRCSLKHLKCQNKSKKLYYTQSILEAKGNQGALSRLTNKLLQKNTCPILLKHSSPLELLNKFSEFFIDKVSNIQDSMTEILDPLSTFDVFLEPAMSARFTQFTLLPNKQVMDLVKNSPIKSTPLDPIPADLLKLCQSIIIPVFTSIINLSLSTGIFLDCLKEARLSPIIKKNNLDREVLNNYRPISNLTYLLELVERAVCTQLSSHKTANHLCEPLQSVYRKFHSTEMAIIGVLNDLLISLDNKCTVYLSLLDCSAAFDLVHPQILLHCLQSRLGVTGPALTWFKSYLTNKIQRVAIAGTPSDPQPCTCGVPQGSVLGPILLSIYTTPIGDVGQSHSTKFHLYADNTQLYLAGNLPDNDLDHAHTIARLEACIADIR